MRALTCLWALALAGFLASCGDGGQPGQERLAGGEGGIGGTGIQSWEGGIGGTGVVGTVTGFGSIIVNGLHIQYDETLTVDSILGRITASELRIGQVVAVEAFGTGDGRLVARAIELRQILAGPVESIDHANRTLKILGETVTLSDRTILAALPGVGRDIIISGLRSGGVIVASRVDSAPTRGFAAVSGTVTRLDARGLYVNGRLVRVQAPLPEGLRVGREIQLAGRAVGGVLHARDVKVRPEVPFGGRMRQMVVEGFAQVAKDRQELRIGNLVVDPAGKARWTVKPGQRLIAYGLRNKTGKIEVRMIRYANPNAQPGGAGFIPGELGDFVVPIDSTFGGISPSGISPSGTSPGGTSSGGTSPGGGGGSSPGGGGSDGGSW